MINSMLILGSRFNQQPVMSLHVGTKIASLKAPIINPDNLKIIAYKVNISPQVKDQNNYLLIEDVREIGRLGIIIDDADHIVTDGDVIRLDKLIDIDFEIDGIAIIDENDKKIGKLTDYSIDLDSFYIKKLHVRKGFFNSFKDTELLIDRSQVFEVTDNYIKIFNKTEKKLSAIDEGISQINNYVNPFRKPLNNPQPESRSSSQINS